MAFRRFKAAYRSFLFPDPVKPPYLHICQVGDPILRQQAQFVPQDLINTNEFKQILQQMQQVMKKYNSVGLAAPQIGIPLRILLLEFSAKHKQKVGEEVFAAKEMSLLPLTTVINPEMKVDDYKKIEFAESCESIRGYSAVVPRFRAVTLTGQNEKGENTELKSIGWTSRIIQHEMEHLYGKLYIDSMNSKTFQNDAWHRINVHQGRVEVKFYV